MISFLSTYWIWILFGGVMVFMHLGHRHGGSGGGHGCGGHGAQHGATEPGMTAHGHGEHVRLDKGSAVHEPPLSPSELADPRPRSWLKR